MADLQFHALSVAAVQAETENAIKISFRVPDDLRETFRYQQGQYLTLESDINGEAVRRSYSICSGINDELMQIAIKRVEGGVFSNYANDGLSAGDVLRVMPPQGNFFTPLDVSAQKRYLFIASGSGITPVVSNIKSILEEEPRSEVTLLFGNQRSGSIMFRETLSFLKNRYLARFLWVNILSREDQGCDVLNGRLNNRKGAELNKQLINLDSFDEYFICGPESMISEVSRGLRGGQPRYRHHGQSGQPTGNDRRRRKCAGRRIEPGPGSPPLLQGWGMLHLQGALA
jgi:ring-1,2-phenylacetyl-CoA epoxidase subunit PaaE